MESAKQALHETVKLKNSNQSSFVKRKPQRQILKGNPAVKCDPALLALRGQNVIKVVTSETNANPSETNANLENELEYAATTDFLQDLEENVKPQDKITYTV
jgi:hypothetical protein